MSVSSNHALISPLIQNRHIWLSRLCQPHLPSSCINSTPHELSKQQVSSLTSFIYRDQSFSLLSIIHSHIHNLNFATIHNYFISNNMHSYKLFSDSCPSILSLSLILSSVLGNLQWPDPNVIFCAYLVYILLVCHFDHGSLSISYFPTPLVSLLRL